MHGKAREEHVVSWLRSEPRLLLWLSTLYRLSVSEAVQHRVRCHGCKAFPITGLRSVYVCLCSEDCLHLTFAQRDITSDTDLHSIHISLKLCPCTHEPRQNVPSCTLPEWLMLKCLCRMHILILTELYMCNVSICFSWACAISSQVSLFKVFQCPSLPKLFPVGETHTEAQAFASRSGILHSGIHSLSNRRFL